MLIGNGHGGGFGRALEHRLFAGAHGGAEVGGLREGEREFERVEHGEIHAHASER